MLPFVLGTVIAYFLHPYADRLEKRGWNRIVATAVVLLAFFAAGIGFLFLFVPILFEQGIRFIQALPGYFDSLFSLFTPLSEKVRGWMDADAASSFSVSKVAQKSAVVAIAFLTRIWSGGMALINFFGLIAITPLVAFYLLHQWPRIVKYVDGLLPKKQGKTIRSLAKDIDALLVNYVNGTVFVCLILSLFYGGTLSLLGLKYGFTIGVTAGLVSFIPYVGAIYGVVASASVALFQFWPEWYYVLGVIVIFIGGQLLSDYILVPKILGNKMRLHPLWIIFGVFAGGALLGFVGMLIAIPLTAVIGVLVRFSLQQYKKSKYYLGKSKK